MDPIYFDYNSTTPIDPEVVQTMSDAMRSEYVNPSSQHRLGQQARQILETEKSKIIDLLGGKTTGLEIDRLVVTSGGTESNNLALFGTLKFQQQKHLRNELIVSAIEHPSVLEAANQLKSQGYIVHHIEVDSSGTIHLEHLRELISAKTALVSVMRANHETGVLQPVDAVSEICREQKVLFHCDATQAIGKIPVRFDELGADMMTVSPHKFYGPRQIGLLLVKRNIELAPLLFGGQQQLGTRPGTEDIAAICGTRKALELCQHRTESAGSIRQLRDRLESDLAQNIADLVYNGASADRLPNTSNISAPGVNRQALLMSADMNGIAVSTGSACASGSSEPSPVLTAMKLPDSIIESAIRISLGSKSTEQHIELATQKLSEIINKLRS